MDGVREATVIPASLWRGTIAANWQPVRPMLMLLVLLPICSLGTDEHPPTPQECPECHSGVYRCEYACNEQHSYSFNFQYDSGACWEQIPQDDRSMIMDIDLWCQIPNTAYLPLTCDNFHLYDFDGVSQLSGCEGNANATGLARESCSWECKNGRPVIRCIWTFGFDDYYDLGERLQECWLSHRCSNESTTEPDALSRTDFRVVCEPTEPVVASFVTRVATVRRDVLAARGSVHEDTVRYSASLSSHEETQAELLEAEASQASADEALLSARAAYDMAVASARLSEASQVASARAGDVLASATNASIAADGDFNRAVARNAAARVELALANATRRDSLEHLASITLEMESVLGSLRGNGSNLTLTQAEALLSEALADLDATSTLLTEERASHNVTHVSLTGHAMSLRAELARYAFLLETERSAHLQTQVQLSHSDQSLDRAEGTVTWLVVLLGLLAAIVVMLGLGLLLTIFYRKQNQGDMTGEIGIGVVVMGRPVAGQVASPSAHDGHPLGMSGGTPASKVAWRA